MRAGRFSFCTRNVIALVLGAHFSGVLWGGPKPQPELRVFALGQYRITVGLDRYWRTRIDSKTNYIAFDYADRVNPKDAFVTAHLGLFPIGLPAEVRGKTSTEIADAFILQDAAGIKKAFFGNSIKFVLESIKPESVNAGSLYSYIESVDRGRGRDWSTKYACASVFFPSSYPTDGTVFIILGLQESKDPEISRESLKKVKEIAGGIELINSSSPAKT